ncbi:MAG: baseplate J/gp47 family protein, partial [Anaerolineaceae bacterium]|nr:baseplate J/gp47 family protein [Anaerolineaceae bacterium]
MKTAILQLDAFDNVISIRDKIAWSKTQRILLVWPNKGKIKLNSIDIILILRSAESLGAQISVVTDEPVIINQLKELGVSIFSSIPEAQKKPWRKPRIRDRSILTKNSDGSRNQLDFDKKIQIKNFELSIQMRWIVFSIGVIATILTIFIFIPSAQITLSPMLEEQSMQMNFRSDPTIKEINMTGAIPYNIVEIEIEGQLEEESTGIIRIPDKKASGAVTFRNISDQEIFIPEGTIVRTSGDPLIRFETTKEATLKPGVESQIDVPILCMSGGTIGNVSGGSITSIENDLGGNIVVMNNGSTYGGVDIKTFSPTENDYEKLKTELIELLKLNAIEEIKDTYPNAILIPEKTIKIE